MKKMISLIACMLVLVLSLTACSQAAPPPNSTSLSSGGILILSVNPKIAVEYDKSGLVTGIIARNEDALAIIADCDGLIGKSTQDVVANLVTRIGEAGYFVDEIDGGSRQIVLEIEPGSALPSETFLDDVIQEVRISIDNHDWTTPLVIEGVTDYGKTDYIDTDYGPNNDGVTDYGKTDYKDTDYGTTPSEPAPTEPVKPGVTDYGKTDYTDTDYGPDNDGFTDYGKTDYKDTDYGTTPSEPTPTEPVNPGITDYGKTDYTDTDYGPDNDGITDYGKTDYHDGKSDYEGKTDYSH